MSLDFLFVGSLVGAVLDPARMGVKPPSEPLPPDAIPTTARWDGIKYRLY